MSKATSSKLLGHFGVKTIADLINKLGLKKESEIMDNPEIHSILGSGPAQTELVKRYKPIGPHTTIPISDNEVDEVLDQWMEKWHDFCNLHFTMIDFEVYGAALATVDLFDLFNGKVSSLPMPLFKTTIPIEMKPYKCAATVLNSDIHTGRGKHWTAIFIDARNPNVISLEFFNSSGNPTYPEVLKWQEKTRIVLSKKYADSGKTVEVKPVQVSNVRHQFSDTECGPYCLYYIFSRLNGVPYENFKHTPVADATVTNFRKKIYREAKKE